MATNSSDISIVLSGGSSNINPMNSLGGNPSSQPINTGYLNNLFDDISKTESVDGHEDYRCLYIFNDGDTTIWNVEVSAVFQKEGGSDIELGIEERNEVQRVSLNQLTPSFPPGYIDFKYKQMQFLVPVDLDVGTMAQNFELILQNLTESLSSSKKMFKGVSVVGQIGTNGSVFFDIKWSNKDSKRNFEQISIVNYLLGPGDIATMSIISEGAPINTIANEIDFETTPPGGITFHSTDEDNPIVITRLDIDEGFPIWIKRRTFPNTISKENDGFSLLISAQSMEP